MPKIKLTDLLIFTFLFTAAVSFPYTRMNVPVWAQYTIKICIELILLISYIMIIKKYRIPLWGNANKKNLLVMIPLVVVIACTMFTIPFAYSVSYNQSAVTSGVLYFQIALAILCPINEELLFRLLIHSQLPIKNRLVKIIASSAIFGLIHLLNFFFNGFQVEILIQVAYAFGLGLILGFIYEYGGSIITCCVFHILYNFVNTVIFSYVLNVAFDNVGLQFYLPCGIVAVVAFVYMALLYVFYFRKQDAYYY